MAVCARRQGIPNLLVPFDNAPEAAVTEGVRVFGMRHLTDVVAFLNEPDRFHALVNALLDYDHFMVAADFDAYWQTQRAIDAFWQRPADWWRR